MKKILSYLKNYLTDHFSLKLYALLAVYIGLCIAFDYTFHFQKNVLYHLSAWAQWPAFSLFYGAFYWGACLLVSWCRPGSTFLKNTSFWATSALLFVMLGLYKSFPAILDLCTYLPAETCFFGRKIARYLLGMATILAPALFLWQWQKEQHDTAGFYGINREKFDWAPYALMLLIMIPLIGAASFQESFLRYYPIYKKTNPDAFTFFMQWNEWISVALFEGSYALGFINIELFFRGILIWGMTRFLKEDVVLPMVALYATFHFVKPLGETISSIFGGFILGVISLKSRSIWGGICIHVSIAWLMELFAWLQQTMQ